MRYHLLILALFLCLLTPTQADELVQFSAITDKTQVKPGSTFLIGAKFKLKDKYHIYWENPGDAGLATNLKAKLPEGMTAGKIIWPKPIVFTQPGPIVGYGYEKEVMLMLPITVAAEMKAGKYDFDFHGDWLVCDDRSCIPGDDKTKLSITVGETDQVATDHVETFKHWQGELLPDIIEEETATLDIRHNWQAKVVGGKLAYAIHWPKAVPKNIQLILGANDDFHISQTLMKHREKVSYVGFTAKLTQFKQPEKAITLLVIYDSPEGTPVKAALKLPVWAQTKEQTQ